MADTEGTALGSAETEGAELGITETVGEVLGMADQSLVTFLPDLVLGRGG